MHDPFPSPQAPADQASREKQARPSREAAVIVPLDGRNGSLSALPVARELAALAEATLHLAHVDPARVPAAEGLLSMLHLSRQDVDGAVLDPRVGAPAEQIVSLARETRSTFIVLCPHAGGAGKELGSTAEGVLENAPCPVIFVPPARGVKAWHFGSALVPHDGTPSSSGAVPAMVELLRKAHASLWVLYVAQADGASPEAGGLAMPRYVDQPQHEWPSWIDEFLDRFHLKGVPNMRFAVAAGEPGDEILRAAREHAVDLIVLGWRGTLASKRAVVLKKILAEAPCPVLVFRVRPQNVQ